MDLQELKIKGVEELREVKAKMLADLHGLRVKAAGKQLKQVHQINALRKTIARISTLVHQKLNSNTVSK